jgi:hypothetical protein
MTPLETATRGEHMKKVRPTTTNVLRYCYSGNQRPNTKLSHMDKNGFANVVSEFAPQFGGVKQLARELRDVLFPTGDRAIFRGTYRDTNIIYNRMIKAFNGAIGCLGKE